MWSTILMIMLVLTALFLILLVLVQRGKGGGLSGAFGGMGGQSAFGTKAGDVFTKVTIGVSTFWIVLCLITVAVLSRAEDRLRPTGPPTPPPATNDEPLPGDDWDFGEPEEPGGPAPADEGPGTEPQP